jgi:hypothetical protein
MKKIVRLTENDLVTIIKKALNEQKLLTEEEHYDYKQKNGHTLVAKDGKKFPLPAGHVWNHRCLGAEEADWLEDKKYGIVFHCGDLNHMFQNEMNLKNFKGSEPLVQSLKKEYCLGNSWNNSKNSKKPGCYIQGSWDRQGGRY